MLGYLFLVKINNLVRFNKLVNYILEVVADIPPPAIIHKAEDTKLTFNEIFEFVKNHEGYKNLVYKDSLGIPTIGIGFNLTRPDAKNIISSVGANYLSVLKGEQKLTDEQIREIFKITIQIAYKDAKKWISNFDGLPKNIKLAILDLSFNMGYPRLSKFIKTKEAIIVGDYSKAAEELTKSKWATQVGNRAKSIIGLFLASS